MERSDFVSLYSALKIIRTQINPIEHDPDFKHMVIYNLKEGKNEFETIKEVIDTELNKFIKEREKIEEEFSIRDEKGKPIIRTQNNGQYTMSMSTTYLGIIIIQNYMIKKELEFEYYKKLDELDEKYKEEFDKMKDYLSKDTKALVLDRVSHKAIPQNISYDLYEYLFPIIYKEE
jgi:predicted restriction endonuclease